MSDALPLPPRPSLEQYTSLARDFQNACNSPDPGAIKEWAARWVETIVRLQGVEITPPVRRRINREPARIEQRWHTLEKTNPRGTCLLADAQSFVAREHGFASWSTFVSHVEALGQANSPVSIFERAVDATVSGDRLTLEMLLHDHADLVRQRSTREHRSTLLHYVSANGVEDFRQKTPTNIVEVARLLLDAGADANAESDAYGGGSTTLGLVATSVHPEHAGVQIALLQTLLDHGARMDQPSAAGTWQSVVNGCVANGQPDAAEFLISRGARVDFEGAAALGRLDLVKNHFDENGVLTRDTTREEMESGFVYACAYGHKDIVDFLLDRGVDPRTPANHAALHRAVYRADVAIVALLLQRGWPVHVKVEGLQATPLELALCVWGDATDLPDRERGYEVVRLLVRAGAQLDSRWFEHDEERRPTAARIQSDPRMQAALRGDTLARDSTR